MFDIIILDSCKKIGGAIKRTFSLKKSIKSQLKIGGVCILKTYFNPVLDKTGKRDITDTISLTKLSQYLITYDFQKADLFTCYKN
ncbi:MAG: hypothetical protein ACTSWY_05605 [Promethearchaeota archaeon]